MSDSQLNRRQYYRINCQAHIEYKSCDISHNQMPRELFNHAPSFYLLEQLTSMDMENNRLLAKITSKDRGTGIYLKFMNKKIETIASLIIAQNNQHKETQLIEISEGGCTIETLERHDTDRTMAISLVLLPQHIGICCYAQVISCKQLNNGFKTTLAFEGLSENTQDMIARLVLQHQAENQRQKQNQYKN